ncbi:ATP-dependent DNA helicase PIF1 [Sarotherodon galilaeus]
MRNAELMLSALNRSPDLVSYNDKGTHSADGGDTTHERERCGVFTPHRGRVAEGWEEELAIWDAGPPCCCRTRDGLLVSTPGKKVISGCRSAASKKALHFTSKPDSVQKDFDQLKLKIYFLFSFVVFFQAVNLLVAPMAGT